MPLDFKPHYAIIPIHFTYHTYGSIFTENLFSFTPNYSFYNRCYARNRIYPFKRHRADYLAHGFNNLLQAKARSTIKSTKLHGVR
jgi:hypothetical protein